MSKVSKGHPALPGGFIRKPACTGRGVSVDIFFEEFSSSIFITPLHFITLEYLESFLFNISLYFPVCAHIFPTRVASMWIVVSRQLLLSKARWGKHTDQLSCLELAWSLLEVIDSPEAPWALVRARFVFPQFSTYALLPIFWTCASCAGGSPTSWWMQTSQSHSDTLGQRCNVQTRLSDLQL